MERIGILGGTFNPPHRGHLALARQARAQLGLDRVLVVPANVAPNKPVSAQDPGAARRLAMCELALAGEHGLQACPLEIERGGTSYTVDTVQSVHDAHPDAELTLIVGADTARTLPGWREPARLLGMVGLAIAQRDAAGAREARDALTAIPGLRPIPPVTSLRMEPVAVSSSLVRQRVAAGASVAELVGESVARYIDTHGLYRGSDAVGDGRCGDRGDSDSGGSGDAGRGGGGGDGGNDKDGGDGEGDGDGGNGGGSDGGGSGDGGRGEIDEAA